MPVRPRNPGDPLSIRASEWNAIARVVNGSLMPTGVRAKPSSLRTAPGVVYARNDTGAAVARFQPLRISGVLSDADDDAFFAGVAFACSAADETDLPPGQWLLALESIPDGEIGRAACLGLFPVRANVTDAGHRFLRVVAGEPLLESCSAGLVPIVWTPAGTGELRLVASLAPAAEEMEIWARLGEATPLAGETWRWEYPWEEVILDGTASTTLGATRNSNDDGPAYNAAEHYNDTDTLGSGIDPSKLQPGWEPVPLGPGVYRLRRQEGGEAWHVVGAIHVDGECADESLILDGGSPSTIEFTPIDGGEPTTIHPEPL